MKSWFAQGAMVQEVGWWSPHHRAQIIAHKHSYQLISPLHLCSLESDVDWFWVTRCAIRQSASFLVHVGSLQVWVKGAWIGQGLRDKVQRSSSDHKGSPLEEDATGQLMLTVRVLPKEFLSHVSDMMRTHDTTGTSKKDRFNYKKPSTS